MIRRTRLVPVHNMAHDLGQHLPSQWETPDAAALLLVQLGYRADDVAAGVDTALRMAREAAAIAASNHPVALALGVARDVAAALAVILCVAVWALPA